MPRAIEGLLLMALLATAAAAGPPRPAGVERALRTLSTLHVLRGLQLTPAQARALGALADEAAAHRERYRTEEAASLEGLRRDVDAYVDRLLAGGAADGLEDPLAQRVYEARGADQARVNAWVREAEELEARARALLTPGQVRVVERFTRCVVAPAYLTDPERVGQAARGSPYLDQLVEVRALDAPTWRAQRGARVEAFLQGVESEVGLLGADRRATLGARCEAVFEEARALTPLGFRLRKGELADFLDLEEQERRHHRLLRTRRTRVTGGTGAVHAWLLSEEARALYPRLGAALLAGVRLPVAPDLPVMAVCRTGSPAPRSCATGHLGAPEGPAAPPGLAAPPDGEGGHP